MAFGFIKSLGQLGIVPSPCLSLSLLCRFLSRNFHTSPTLCIYGFLITLSCRILVTPQWMSRFRPGVTFGPTCAILHGLGDHLCRVTEYNRGVEPSGLLDGWHLCIFPEKGHRRLERINLNYEDVDSWPRGSGVMDTAFS